MNKYKNESDFADKGSFLFTDTDGTEYFVMGKIRIKVSEHFAKNGKPIGTLLEDVIQHVAAAS